MSLLQCVDVTKRYGDKVVLNRLNLTLESGKIVGLLGKNGTGKSTLMKLCNDLLTPTSGQIFIDGKPIGVETKKIVSYLPERSYLDKNMTVSQAIAYFADFYEDFSVEKAEGLCKDLDLDLSQKILKMSKGMQEKVQLALVMSRNARLYILDEPLGGVDPATRDYILQTILRHFHPEATLLISTHIISDVESILDEVLFLDHGEIILHANADQLRMQENASVDQVFRRMFQC